jgi:murein DD-endopeptidase MepM/ murein hydrolase activator NlpD
MIRTTPFHAVATAAVLAAAFAATSEAERGALHSSTAEPRETLAEPERFVFPVTMTACKGMASVNKLMTDTDRVILDYAPLVVVEGRVTLAAAPVEAGCVSSVFGPRTTGTHKGVDFFNREPVDIYAAGAGTVKEMTYRDDFGNMLVIDHGHGVFTRYGHLESFGEGLAEGEAVRAGDVIGVMGNTAGYAIARHLHYEVLTGEWGAQAASFALTPVNVLALPEARSDAKS